MLIDIGDGTLVEIEGHQNIARCAEYRYERELEKEQS
jgi:hypothetical protein